MSKVLAGMTMSMDGYVTGPNDRRGAGLGDGGERLHYWVFGGPWTYGNEGRGAPADVDRDYMEDVFASGGAMIVGRTMHDVVDGWGDDPGFGVPVFVVTHRARETQVKGDTTFTFVNGGLDEALARAREAAGEKNIIVMGGADVLRQCLDAGVVDELMLTIAPVLLGAASGSSTGSGALTSASSASP
jgi:dihydrofolate reductase